MFKHLLVPIDSTEFSNQSVPKAILFAKQFDAKITFFCAVQSFQNMYYGLDAIFDPNTLKMFLEEVEYNVKKILLTAEKLARKSGVQCNHDMIMGTNKNLYQSGHGFFNWA